MDLHREFSWGPIRPWARTDAPLIVPHANNLNVARYMFSTFPHPYAVDDALFWLSSVLDPASRDHSFAIEVGGEPIGSIGLTLPEEPGSDEGEVGYWLGEAFWGRGIATDALRAMVEHAFESHGLTRLQAIVYAPNSASARVLAKGGFSFVRTIEKAPARDGQTLDELVFALDR